MKITKAQLKQLIQEELENFDVLDEQVPPPEGADATAEAPAKPAAAKRERDVDILLRTIDKINMPAEYQQVLDAIVSHGAQVRGGKIALVKLSRTLAQTAAKMK